MYCVEENKTEKKLSSTKGPNRFWGLSGPHIQLIPRIFTRDLNGRA